MHEYESPELPKNFIDENEYWRRYENCFCFERVLFTMHEVSLDEKEKTEAFKEVEITECSSEISCMKFSDPTNLIEMINKGKINVNLLSPHGVSFLAIAAAANELELINALLKNGANVDYHGTSRFQTPIMEAVLNGHIEAVQILIKHKANLNIMTKQGATVITIACYQGFSEILELLCANNAKIEVEQGHERERILPFIESISRWHLSCFKILTKYFPSILAKEQHITKSINNKIIQNVTTFKKACSMRFYEAITYIHDFKKAANIIHYDEYYSAYEEAVLQNSFEVTKMLEDFGLDISIPCKFKNYPLSMVSSRGIVERIIYYIEKNQDINYQNLEGVTPLMEACREGHLKAVEELIKRGANVNSYIKISCESAISFAASSGHLEIVKYLIENGVKHNPLANIGLIEAIRENRKLIIEYMLSAGISLNSFSPLQKETPLGVACDNDHEELIEMLLEKGADVNTLNLDQYTPLMRAAKNGNKKVVELLLSKGCDVNAILINKEHTALSLACFHGNLDIVKILVEAGANLLEEYCDGVTILMYASHSTNPELLEYIYAKIADEISIKTKDLQIKSFMNEEKVYTSDQKRNNYKVLTTSNRVERSKSVDIEPFTLSKCNLDSKSNKKVSKNKLEKCGYKQILDLSQKTISTNETVLMIAVSQGNYEMVVSLLEKGSDVNQKDRINMTPLMLACFHGYIEIARLLLVYDALINEVCNSKRFTALCYAIINDRIDCVKMLVDANANIETESIDGLTPLCLAASKCSIEIVKYLVEKGARVNLRRFGPSPLMLALTNPVPDLIVKYLIFKGADPTVEHQGLNFIGVAASNGYTMAFSWLGEIGYKFDLKNSTGTYMLIDAITKRRTDLIKALLHFGADMNNYMNHSTKMTPLMIAIDANYREAIDLLIQSGANVDFRNKKNQTALWIACEKGDLKTTQLLIEHNATVDVKDTRNLSAIRIAAQGGHVEIVKLLIDNIRVFLTDFEIKKIKESISGQKETQESIKECLQILMEVKEKKEAESQKSAENFLNELKKEEKKKEEQNVKKSASQKKRDKKKKKKVVKQPEPQEIKIETPPSPISVTSTQIALKIEKTSKSVKHKPIINMAEIIINPEQVLNLVESEKDEWEVGNKKHNHKLETIIKIVRAKIPSRMVGRLIGKLGASINEIRVRTGTTIDVDTTNKSTNEECNLTVRGLYKDVRSVLCFIALFIKDQDRSTISILEEVEQNKSIEPVPHIFVTNFKDRSIHSYQKEENQSKSNNQPQIQSVNILNEPELITNDFPKRILPNRNILKIEDTSKMNTIKKYDSKPKITSILPKLPSIIASNVKWSVEPEVTTRSLATSIHENTVRTSVTLPSSTISQPRNVNMCPGTGRPDSTSVDKTTFKCPIWEALHSPSLNVCFDFDEELWNMTSSQVQPFSQTIFDSINEFKLGLNNHDNENIPPQIQTQNINDSVRSNISNRTWFDSTTQNL